MGSATFWEDRHQRPAQTKRLQTIARGYARNPSSSIPQLFTRISDVKATYSFFDREDLSPEAIQADIKH